MILTFPLYSDFVTFINAQKQFTTVAYQLPDVGGSSFFKIIAITKDNKIIYKFGRDRVVPSTLNSDFPNAIHLSDGAGLPFIDSGI